MASTSGNPPLVVRRARPADAAAIQTLYRELVDNPAVSVSAERIAEVAQDVRTVLLVAEVGDVVVGTLLVSLCLDVMFKDQPFAVVENVVVASAHRRSGAGNALMRAAEQHCKETGCTKIMLLSSAERADAHRFFERAGFRGSVKKGFVKYRSQFG